MMRLQILLWTVLIAGASAALFQVSQEVKGLNRELTGLNREILAEQESIRVLRAEWAFLNQPARLRTLAAEHLELAEVSRAQFIASADDIPLPLPTVPVVGGAASGFARAVAPYPLRKPGDEPPVAMAMAVSAAAAEAPTAVAAPVSASPVMVNEVLTQVASAPAVPLPPRPVPRPAARPAQEAVASAPAPATSAVSPTAAPAPRPAAPAAAPSSGSAVDLVLASLRSRQDGEVAR